MRLKLIILLFDLNISVIVFVTEYNVGKTISDICLLIDGFAHFAAGEHGTAEIGIFNSCITA
jgi:hypothetical protein